MALSTFLLTSAHAMVAPIVAQARPEESESGSFLVTPEVGTVLVTLGAVLTAAVLLVLLARRLRRPATVDATSGPVTARWVWGLRGLVDFFVVVYALGALFAIGALALGSNDTSIGGDGLAISHDRVEMRIDASIFGSYGSPAEEEVQAAKQRTYGEWYGRGAAPVEGQEVDVAVDDPSLGLWALAVSTVALGGLALGAFLLALRSLLVRSESVSPFDLRNVAALRWMGLALGLGSLLVSGGRWFVANQIVETGGGSQSVGFDVPWSTLIGAVAVLALAEVWRYGVSLQSDVEATV